MKSKKILYVALVCAVMMSCVTNVAAIQVDNTDGFVEHSTVAISTTRASGEFEMTVSAKTKAIADSSFPLEAGETVRINASYAPEDSNWCYYISGNGWYMVKIEEDNVSFLRFSPISKYFPSHVVKISDIATYNLTQERYEKKVGWDDATFIISPDQEVGISVRLHEVKNGSLQDSILLLKISKSCSDICDGCDFAQIVTTGQGSNVLVSVLRQPIEQ